MFVYCICNYKLAGISHICILYKVISESNPNIRWISNWISRYIYIIENSHILIIIWLWAVVFRSNGNKRYSTSLLTLLCKARENLLKTLLCANLINHFVRIQIKVLKVDLPCANKLLGIYIYYEFELCSFYPQEKFLRETTKVLL